MAERQDLIDAVNLICGYVNSHLPKDWEINLKMTSVDASISLEDPAFNVCDNGLFDGDSAMLVDMCNFAQEAEANYAAAEAEKAQYLIECREHKTGSNRLWWAPDSKGYTFDVDKAGRYSLKDAKRICDQGADEKMWTEAEVIAEAKRVLLFP